MRFYVWYKRNAFKNKSWRDGDYAPNVSLETAMEETNEYFLQNLRVYLLLLRISLID